MEFSRHDSHCDDSDRSVQEITAGECFMVASSIRLMSHPPVRQSLIRTFLHVKGDNQVDGCLCM